ncbi:hypothetical protein Scep_014382 [Stephania cephalantha]|uniref:Uncharacterized protein n=1 Tax=Stephania cephalantha TaxID=152367 RepID=A0AAP0J3Q6_9MAGN
MNSVTKDYEERLNSVTNDYEKRMNSVTNDLDEFRASMELFQKLFSQVGCSFQPFFHFPMMFVHFLNSLLTLFCELLGGFWVIFLQHLKIIQIIMKVLEIIQITYIICLCRVECFSFLQFNIQLLIFKH